MEQEIDVLNKLDHAYVVKYQHSFQDEKYVYIVMQFIEGQELFDWMEERGICDELETCNILHKLLQAINHIHSVGIIHRDIKPENIMVDDDGEPKIIDFGLSKDTVAKFEADTRIVGSKIFMAPEVFLGFPHTMAMDIWSLGIILFMMVSGQYPFSLRNVEKEITDSPVLFLGPAWENISAELKGLILAMLDKDSGARISAKEALHHPWFNMRNRHVDIIGEDAIEEDPVSPTKLDKKTLGNLMEYRGMSKLRMAGINILVSMLKRKDIDPLRTIFQDIDKDETGFITPEELSQALAQSDLQLTKEQE